jgi:predicted dienelactone hydrolase
MVRLLLIGFVVLVAACSSDSESNPETRAPEPSVDAPDELSSFAVGHRMFNPVDSERADRELLVDVWYPVDAEDAEDAEPRQYSLGGFAGQVSDVALADAPVATSKKHHLLVFSHGYGGIGTQSIELMEVLASHGFIVASPEHTGNSQTNSDDTFDEAAANRVPDVSFVIDTMLARSADREDPFFGAIEEEGIGVLGNSFGAMTAIGMAAGWAGADADPRVDAILPVSGVIDAELQSDERTSPNAGFTEEQLEAIVVPTMLMGGTEDVNVFLENNEIAFNQIVNAPAVYKVDIIGANHTHFASVCQFGELLIGLGIEQDQWQGIAPDLIEPYANTCGPDVFPIEEANRLQNLYTVAFFRRHILGEEGYEAYLTPEFADTEPAINFQRK